MTRDRESLRQRAQVCRRQLFRTAAMAVGGAALFSATIASTAARADSGKMSKAAAAYQEQPKGDQSCANCALFAPPDACGVVEGAIKPSGWCKLYQKKS